MSRISEYYAWKYFKGFCKSDRRLFFPPLVAVTQRKKKGAKLERLPKTEIKVDRYDSVEQVLSLNKCWLCCRLNLLAAKWGKLGLRGTDRFHSQSEELFHVAFLLTWREVSCKGENGMTSWFWMADVTFTETFFKNHLKNRQNKSWRSFCASAFNFVSSHLQKLTQRRWLCRACLAWLDLWAHGQTLLTDKREKMSNVFTHAVSPSHTPMRPSLTDSGGWHWVWGWVILRWLALTHCNWVGVVKKINYMDSVFFGPDLHARWH